MGLVYTEKGVLQAYDDACREWQIRFGYPVFARSVANARHSTSFRKLEPSRYQGTWIRTGLKEHFWDILLQSLAIGGDGPKLLVTFPETIFTFDGPFQANLRALLQSSLRSFALPQNKERERGVFIGGYSENRMRIRVPHR